MDDNYPTVTPAGLKLAQKIADDIWATYDDSYGYATEKRQANKNVSTENPDNIWFFWNQFDAHNHTLFTAHVLAERAMDTPGSESLVEFVIAAAEYERDVINGLRDQGIEL